MSVSDINSGIGMGSWETPQAGSNQQKISFIGISNPLLGKAREPTRRR